MTRKHETPDWIDETLEREELTFEEYLDFWLKMYGVSRTLFWTVYWSLKDKDSQQKFVKESLEEFLEGG